MSGCKEYKILFDYEAREPDEINLKKGKVGSKKYYLKNKGVLPLNSM